MRFLSRSYRIKTFMSLLTIGVGFIFVVGASAEPPLGILGDVTIQNDASNPVPVTIQGGETKEPFQRNFTFSFNSGGETDETIKFTVPPEKRLVLEYLDLTHRTLNAPAGQIAQARLSHQETNEFSFATLLLVSPGFGLVGGGQKILYHAGSEVEVSVNVKRENNANTEAYQVTISGHLIDE